MDPESTSIEDALPQVTPDPMVGQNPPNIPQQPPSNGPLPVPTPAGGFVSPETPAPKKTFLKSNFFLILLAMIILVLIAAISFYFIKIKPANQGQSTPSSSVGNQSQNYSQSNNLENQNPLLNPNLSIPANAAVEGKLFIRSKNGDLMAKDVASGQEITIAKGGLILGPGLGGGDAISPNGQYVYYAVPGNNTKQNVYIFDFKSQQSYQINNVDSALTNIKWSEDSKALMIYSLNDTTISKAQLIAVDESSLSSLTPKEFSIPERSKSQLQISRFPNNSELWYLVSDQNEQMQQIYQQAYSQGQTLSEQDAKSLMANLVIHIVLSKLNIQSQKVDKIMEVDLPLSKADVMSHCSSNNDFLTQNLLNLCSQNGQGTFKLYFLDPRDLSVKKEVQILANNVNENTVIILRVPKAQNKVIIETENTLNQGTGEERTLYFRQLPDLTELPNELPVKLQEISPNFNNKFMHIEAISPYGVFMVFSVQENCQPKVACDKNYYLYDFRNKNSKLVYTEKAGDLNIRYVKEVTLTGY